MLTGTRRRVKTEKIPQLLTASCTDSLKSEPMSVSPCPSAETVEVPNGVDDTGKSGCKTLLPSVSSGSSLRSPCPKKLKQTENAFHLTTQVQDTVRFGTMEEDDGKRQDAEAVTEQESSQVSCCVNPEAEDSQAELIDGVEHRPVTPQVNCPSVSKAVVSAAVQLDNQSHMATSERQRREKSKPKLVHIRRAADGPDQNCKTQ